MAIFIDEVMNYGGSATFRWKDSCHMYADSLHELMEFATKKLRLKAAWFQDKRIPHFDLNSNKARLALTLGAIQHTRREAVDFWAAQGWFSPKLRQMEFDTVE